MLVRKGKEMTIYDTFAKEKVRDIIKQIDNTIGEKK